MDLRQQVTRLSKLLARQHFEFTQTVLQQQEQIKELDTTAKKLVRRDLELQETSEAFRQLEEAKAKADALLTSIGEAVIAVDAHGKIIFLNQFAQTLLGLKSQDALGKLCTDLMRLGDGHGNFLPLDRQPIHLSLSQGKQTSTSNYLLRVGNRDIPITITASPVVTYNKIRGAIVVFADITQQKEIDKAKTEFVSLASHQLRTPLSTINWYAETLLEGDLGPLNDQQKSYLAELYRSNQRMVELVNALLDVSRIELGTFVIDPEPTKIAEVADSVLGELLPQSDAKALKIQTSYDENLPIVSADPKLVRIILQNLLSNAIQYTPAGGQITLELTRLQSSILIKVKDTGYGIPQQAHPKVFTKLFRADNIRDKEAGGTGLGLYIVKSIVDQSGGKIWFESRENQGTTFYVTIPLSGMKRKEGTKHLTS